MKKILIVLCVVLFAAGCTYHPEREIFIEDGVRNSKVFEATKGEVYKAIVKTMLMKNFSIKEEDFQFGTISAERVIERGKYTYILFLRARIFKESDGLTSVFLNGSEHRERNYVRTRRRRFLFIPIPGSGRKEVEKVVESKETIWDREFFDEILFLIKQNIYKKLETAKRPVIGVGFFEEEEGAATLEGAVGAEPETAQDDLL